jgi:uncharacterized protein YprB with RNaseH-like and TPR domain
VKSEIERLRQLLASTGAPRQLGPAPAPVTGFLEVETPGGKTWVRERQYGPGATHGTFSLRSWAGVTPEALSFLAGGRCATPGLLFVDVEATGLGGAGTQVFLAGVARLVGEELVLTQHFLPGPGHEAAFLYELKRRWPPEAWLVTYNGKSFDWPLLSDRYTLHGQNRPAISGHLDLLFWARRLLGPGLANCTLVNLERELLGISRLGDIPSQLIPAAYFDYIRRGDPGCIDQVLEHNLQDLLSLVALSCTFATYTLGRLDTPFAGPIHLGLARRYEEQGDDAQARACYHRALDGELADQLRGLALRRLGFLEKRRGDQEKAQAAFAAAVDILRYDPVACTELAKHLEHRAGEFDQAARLVRQALSGPSGCTEPWRSRLQQRLSRLERRQNRSRPPRAGEPAPRN